ncbi:MAG: response regulator [Chloroflexi bacterium]|nr:response regulator [Chloroflexota bacterium]
MSTPLKVLLVEDSEDDALLLVRNLSRAGYEVNFKRVDSPDELLAALARSYWDIVVADYNVPGIDAPDTIRYMRQAGSEIPVLVVSNELDEETAAKLMLAGAKDFVSKKNLARLSSAIDRELKEAQDREARKRAEASLKRTRDYLQLLVNRIPDVIFRYIFKPERGYEYVSPAITTLFGYSPEEFYADPDLPLKIIHPDNRQLYIEMLHQQERTKEYLDEPVEFCWVRKDGIPVWAEEISSPVYDDKGNIVAVEGMLRDVTQRRKAAAELRQRNAELEAMYVVARAAVQSTPQQERVETILNELMQVSGAISARLWVPSSAPELLSLYAQVGTKLPGEQNTLPIARSLGGKTFRDTQVTVVNNYQEFPEAIGARTEQGLHSGIGLPLIVGETIIGVITLAAKQVQHFNEKRVAILSTMRDMVAAALYQAQLLSDIERNNENLQQRLREITALNEMFREQASTHDVMEKSFQDMTERMRAAVVHLQEVVQQAERVAPG